MNEVKQHVSSSTPITLSKTAIRHIESYLAKQENSHGVRFSVKKNWLFRIIISS